MNRPKQIILAAGLLTAWLTTAPSETQAADAKPDAKPADKIAELFGDPVVAKGTGMEIKRSQLDAAVMGIKASGAARGQQLNAEQSLMLERQVLDRLMQIELLNAKATEADKTKGKEESKKRLDIIQKRAGSEENLTRQLKSVGMSLEELTRKMTEEATAEAVVIRELKADATDEEARKYFDEHPARFEQPEMIRASHILLSILDQTANPPTPLPDDKKQAKRKLAEELLKRARGGEDFAKLAREYSEDQGSRENGGEYKFPRGQMVPEFESAAFGLDINQISDIVTTQFGYHIIKLSEKMPARKLALDETVEGNKISDQVKDLLKRQKLEKLLPDFIAKLQQDSKVEVLDEKLKKAGEMIEAAKADNAAAQKAAEAKPGEKPADEKK